MNAPKNITCIVVTILLLLISLPGAAQQHSADTSGDTRISLTELLRIIQFYNSAGLHCLPGTEDGYAPGPDSAQEDCPPHDSDYAPQDWQVNLTELLRSIQFYNSGGYHTQCGTEDDFAPGPGTLFDCGSEGEGEGTEGEGEGEGEGAEGEGEG
ncbi:MAG TPA: hypothetical protein PLI09_18285, partial [Candidatus Hydrogenedentes bacterium]|nr:hypothetical protein [Candidatus Hydrogenedentota bacterium]